MENESKKHTFPKKLVVCAVLIATLSAAVYLNWQYNLNNGDLDLTAALSKTEKYIGDAEYVNATVPTTTSSDFFSKSRNEREETRKQSLKALQDVLSNAKSDEKSKNEANEKIKSLTQNDKLQSDIETLVKAKGFSDCIAIINEKENRNKVCKFKILFCKIQKFLLKILR